MAESNYVAFLSIPGLRRTDLPRMKSLSKIRDAGGESELHNSFPAVTWPSQATMLTGCRANEHGVIANGFYWRGSHKVEMWTAWNEVILRPQIWDLLRDFDGEFTSAAWFPMLSKGCGADFVCMPAPIHQPDGTEDLWCYTKPQEFYGELLEQLEHFPLQHFWGPMANIQSSKWIAESAAAAASKFRPNFFYVYLPHLDYASQKLGPDSDAAMIAIDELDTVVSKMISDFENAYDAPITWIVASEYVITPTDHASFPNRVLREHGLLETKATEDGELLDFVASQAWAMVDHQFSHVFLADRSPEAVAKVALLFQGVEGIEKIVYGDSLAEIGMDHERSGEIVLVSSPNSWQAYYWWLDDTQAPGFARTVDIHRKPGYDPVELHFDLATKSIPLDATLIGGSHGVMSNSLSDKSVIICNEPGFLDEELVEDTSICHRVLNLLSK